jgi:hypothetical protein
MNDVKTKRKIAFLESKLNERVINEISDVMMNATEQDWKIP